VNEKFVQYRDRTVQYWQQFSKKQKIMLAATVGGLILVIILLTYMFSRTEYELAFQNLDATDAAAIIQHLEEAGVPFELGPDGTSISVPSAMATQVKVDVGSQGMVQNGSIGFESFNEGVSQFGMTDNEFDVRYRNALNGEVQQLLNDMTGVQRTNVLINLPEESVFADSEEELASASITMEFKAGFRPSQEQIDGYYNLVKTAVPNLTVDNITISSQEAELVASDKLSGGAGFASSAVEAQFQVQRKYENDLKRNIHQFLGKIIGGDNLVISVASTMNFDQRTSTENKVEPLEGSNSGIVISENIENSTTTGSSGQAGGVTGTGETDVPGYQAVDGSSTTSSEDSSRTTNYEISRIQSQVISAPFVVRDLSIGIGVAEGALTDESRDIVMSYLTTLVRTQLAESGQDLMDDTLLSRKVSLISQPFAEGADGSSPGGLPLGWAIGIGAAALAVGVIAAVVLMRRRRQAAIAAAEEESLQPAKVELPTIDLDQVTTESQMRKQLEQFAKRKPEDFVNLLRTWLVDE
jgi:flagellar M-ring protein FliF